MAAKKAAKSTKKATPAVHKEEAKAEVPTWLKETPANTASLNSEEGLDPQEEKVLDWILKGVVGFVLVWLGVSVLMVIGGFFHLWG